MNKFWEWMEKKDYGYYDKQEGFETYCVIWDGLMSKKDDYDQGIKPTKQMLIGYMIEYLLTIEKYNEELFNVDIRNEDLYSELEILINRVDKDT
jgi:hypothetical protein